MALFGLSLKKIKEGIDFGNTLLNVAKPIISNLPAVFSQPSAPAPQVQPQLPAPQAPRPQQFDFKSTFKQPGAPQLPTQTLNLSSFSTKLPTAPNTVIDTIKQVAPTLPTPQKPITPMDIIKPISLATSIGVKQSPIGETTLGKYISQGTSELSKGNIPGALKSAGQATQEAGMLTVFGPSLGTFSAQQAAMTKTDPVRQFERNMDFLRAIEKTPYNVASYIPSTVAGIGTAETAISKAITKPFIGETKANKIAQQKQQTIKGLYDTTAKIQKLGPEVTDDKSIQSQSGNFVGSVLESIAIGLTGPAAVPIWLQQAQGRVAYETYQQTGDLNKSALTGAVYAPVEAVLEKLTLGRYLKPAVSQTLKQTIKNIVKTAIQEGATEGAQQFSENAIRMVAGDKSVENIWQGVPESVIFGGLAGGTISGPIEINNLRFVNNQLKQIQQQQQQSPIAIDPNLVAKIFSNTNASANQLQEQLLKINPETQVGRQQPTQQQRQIEQQQVQAEQQRLAQEQAAPQATSNLLQGYQLPTQTTQTDIQAQVQDITTQFPKMSPQTTNRLVQQYGYSRVIGLVSEVQKSGTAKNLEAVVTSEAQKRFGKPAPVTSEASKTSGQITIKQTSGNTLNLTEREAQSLFYNPNLETLVKNLKSNNIDINSFESAAIDRIMELQKLKKANPNNVSIGLATNIKDLKTTIELIAQARAELAKPSGKPAKTSEPMQGVNEPTTQNIQPQDRAQSTNSDFGQQATDTTVKHELQKSLDSIKGDVGNLLSDINQQPFTFEQMAQDIQRASRDPKFKPSKEVMAYYKNIKSWLDAWADYAGLEGIKTKEYYLPQFRENYVYDYNDIINNSVFTLDTLDFGFSNKRQDKINLSNLDYSTEGLVRYAIQAKAYALRHDIRAEQIMQEQARDLEIENTDRQQQGLEPLQPITKEQAVKAAQSEEDLVKSIQNVKTTYKLGKEVSKASTVEDLTKPANINPEMTKAQIDAMQKQDERSILDKFTEQGKNEGKVIVKNEQSPGAIRQQLQDSFGIYKRMLHTNYYSATQGTMWDMMGFDLYQTAPATAQGIIDSTQVNNLLRSKTQQQLVYDFAEFYLNKAAYPAQHDSEINNPNTDNIAYKIYREIANASSKYNENTLLHRDTIDSIINKSADYAVFRLSKRIAPVSYSDDFMVGTWTDLANREGFRPNLEATARKVAELSQAVPNEIIPETEINRINQIQHIILSNMQRKMGTQVLVNELKRTQFTDKTLRKVLTKDVMRMLRQDNFNRSFIDQLTDGVTGVVHTAALGLNVSSALFNPLETKQIYALFGGKAYREALRAATQPGGFDITEKYGIDATKGSNLPGYGDNIENINGEKPKVNAGKKVVEASNNALMYMFNKGEQWKDAVMLHAFEAKGKSMGLTEQALIDYVMTNFNKYGIKYGQFGTLGFNKTRVGRVAFQFMQYSIKNAAITIEQANTVMGWGSKQNVTSAERKNALKYLGRKTLFDIIAYLILSRLMGAGWEQVFGFFNPFSRKAKSDNAYVQALMYMPTGPILASMLNLADAYLAEQINSEDQAREFTWKKVLTPTVKSNISLAFPAGVQLFNKTGVQNLIPGIRDWLDQGAIKDMQRGYNVSVGGQARFQSPDNPFEIAKALVFGPYSTDYAKEYFGQSPVGGILPGELRGFPGAQLFGIQPGRKYVPIPKKLQEELSAGKFTPAEAIKRGRELDAKFKSTFEAQPGDTPTEATNKANLRGQYNEINKTVFNPQTGKRESDVLSREKWAAISADTSLRLFNFYKDRSKLYADLYGYSIDPIFEFTDPAQIREVLQLRGTYTGNKIEREEILRATEPWYREYEKKYREYGKQIAANKIEPGDDFGFSARKQAYIDIKPPENTTLMEQYFALKNKDAAAAKQFFKDNADQLSADFTNYKQQKLNYINEKRRLEGVGPIPASVFNNVTFGYEDDERKVFYELYYQKGFGKQFGRRPRTFYQPSIYRSTRLPSTSAGRIGMGRKIQLRPGRIVVRQNRA